MPKFVVPTEATIHASRHFLFENNFFGDPAGEAVLEFHPKYMHIEPLGLAMIAAWGAWCQRQEKQVKAVNISRRTDYAARMGLFEQLRIPYETQINEHEEIGRFLPLTNVKTQADLRAVIADVSALLHLHENPDSLAAVQYCLSELLRNVLEHSGSPDGGFVCAHNFSGKGPHRVTIAVADCGMGIATHLGRAHPEVLNDDIAALRSAMTPGITGALPGAYGTPDNAGAGLFITRCIAKGTGGYFELISGRAGYRLRRERLDGPLSLSPDPFGERHDIWEMPHPWLGTVVTIEIGTEAVNDFEHYFGWIIEQLPQRISTRKKVRFT